MDGERSVLPKLYYKNNKVHLNPEYLYSHSNVDVCMYIFYNTTLAMERKNAMLGWMTIEIQIDFRVHTMPII